MTCKAPNSSFCCRMLIKAFLLAIYSVFSLISKTIPLWLIEIGKEKNLNVTCTFLSNFNFDWFYLPIFNGNNNSEPKKKFPFCLILDLHNFVPVIKKCCILLYPYSVRSIT